MPSAMREAARVLQSLVDMAPKYVLEQFLQQELLINITEHEVGTETGPARARGGGDGAASQRRSAGGSGAGSLGVALGGKHTWEPARSPEAGGLESAAPGVPRWCPRPVPPELL